jgi:hypothetical protein
MKVERAIEELQRYPADAEVLFGDTTYDGWNGSDTPTTPLDANFRASTDPATGTPQVILFRAEPAAMTAHSG